MSTSAKPEAPRVDQFLMAAEARFDRWRRLLQAARTWERSTQSAEVEQGEASCGFDRTFPGVAVNGRITSLIRDKNCCHGGGTHRFG